MDLQQLKLFLSISRTLNFTSTANEFFMTQPTVSNRIRALENELGVQLLKRSSHHVSLTKAGAEYVGYAANIIKTQAEAELRIRNIAADRPGLVKVAMLSSSSLFFSQALKEFSVQRPKVQVDVSTMEGLEMLRAIAQADYDLYFANESLLPEKSSRLNYTVTGVSQLHLYVNKDILHEIDMNDWSTIEKQPFLSMQASDFTLSSQIERLCQNRGIRPSLTNYYNRADMLLLSVSSGAGVAILPAEFASIKCPDNVVALPISGEDATLRSVVAWKTDSDNLDADCFRDIALSL